MNTYNESALIERDDRTGISCINGRRITIKGSSKVYGVIKEFSKYGLITFSKFRTFKRTEYTMHFIKPVNKLKQLYNLGDEVLILCCNDNFTQFKSRTKDFIDFLLATKSEFRNRLDKIICFLIDNNDDITELVKKDRVDNPDSRLIVPFSYTEILNGLTDDLLQSRLRIFVYERDLFGIATPLQNDNMFYGKDRTNIISDLYGKYRQGEHGGLFGLRRIGKTSILNLLKQRVNQTNGVAIYFDCTKYHHLRWYEFLKQMLIDIKKEFLTESDRSTYLFENKEYDDKSASIDFEKD